MKTLLDAYAKTGAYQCQTGRKYNPSSVLIQNFSPLANFCGLIALFVSNLVGDCEDRFYHDTVHVYKNICCYNIHFFLTTACLNSYFNKREKH